MISTPNCPVDFGDLLGRVSPLPLAARAFRPMVATASEPGEAGSPSHLPMWVVMHTVTDSTVQLFHARPLHGRKLTVRVEAASGETVQVLLAVASTCLRGDLYETTANFYK